MRRLRGAWPRAPHGDRCSHWSISARLDLPRAARDRLLANALRELLASPGRRAVSSPSGPARYDALRQDHRHRHHRPGQRTPADLVDARDEAHAVVRTGFQAALEEPRQALRLRRPRRGAGAPCAAARSRAPRRGSRLQRLEQSAVARPPRGAPVNALPQAGEGLPRETFTAASSESSDARVQPQPALDRAYAGAEVQAGAPSAAIALLEAALVRAGGSRAHWNTGGHVLV